MTRLPPDIVIRIAGEDQAVRRAGPWGYPFNRRYRFWLNPDAWERAAPQGDRRDARRRKAIEIAEEREWHLKLLLRIAA